MLPMIVGSTHSCTVVGMAMRYCILNECYVLSSALSPDVVIMRYRELYINLQSVECRLPLAMNGIVHRFL